MPSCTLVELGSNNLLQPAFAVERWSLDEYYAYVWITSDVSFISFFRKTSQ